MQKNILSKCLYNSWCITYFSLKGKIISWAQITKKWDAKYPEICSYATLPLQGKMSQLRTPTGSACAEINALCPDTHNYT